MTTFNGTLSKEVAERFPYPGHLGTTLMMNLGYVFAGVPEEYHKKDERVPMYNVLTLVGYITYVRKDDGSVDVIIEDVENPQGNILTNAANQAMQR